MRLRLLPALAAVLVAATVAACGGLPGTGPVTDGRRLDEPIDEGIRIAPQLPMPGSSPEQIARDFIVAAEDTDETHATAKNYLAHSSVDLWQWSTEETVIYNRASDLKVERTSPGAVRVSVIPVGVLSTTGRYRDAERGAVISATFGLTQVGGQWRLELPKSGFGMWLEASAFDRLYVSAPVHYVTPSGRELIPDPRWFLRSTTSLATSLARAQLEPVPTYLAGSVTTGIPKGTRLAVNSVPVVNGHADVNLTGAAREAGPEDRRSMFAQLSATLARASVSSLSVAAEGTALDLPGLGGSLSSPQAVGYALTGTPVSDTALIRAGERFQRINPNFIPDENNPRGSRVVNSRPDDPAPIPQAWVRLTLSRDGQQVGAISHDFHRLSIWPAHNQPVELPHFANVMTRPVFDRSQYLWVAGVDPDARSRIWAINTAALVPVPEPDVVSAPWLGNRTVVALTLSADGTRALVITRDPKTGESHLDVAGVDRAPNGEPKELAEPLRQAQPLTSMSDVVWLDPDSYAVLGRLAPDDPVRPWIGHLGAGLDGIRARSGVSEPTRERLDPVPSATTITTVGASRGIICLTDNGRILARVGLGWIEINQGSDLLVPGR